MSKKIHIILIMLLISIKFDSAANNVVDSFKQAVLEYGVTGILTACAFLLNGYQMIFLSINLPG